MFYTVSLQIVTFTRPVNGMDGKGNHLGRRPIQVLISCESDLGGAFMKERIIGWEPPGKIQEEAPGLYG